MSALLSLNNIKVLKNGFKCLDCLTFYKIVNASEVWNIDGDSITRQYHTIKDDCLFSELFFDGKRPCDDDLKKVKDCDKYIHCEEWIGINKNFINMVGALEDYVYLTIMKRVTKQDIFAMIKTLSNRSGSVVKPETEVANKSINDQFLVEKYNYSMMEEVRRYFANASVSV